jgi:hypothetical protein
VRAILPADVAQIGEPQIDLVDERRRLQRVIATVRLACAPVRDAATPPARPPSDDRVLRFAPPSRRAAKPSPAPCPKARSP